jgi:hypothetical protein
VRVTEGRFDISAAVADRQLDGLIRRVELDRRDPHRRGRYDDIQSASVADNIPIQAARIPDRDRLVAELREAGLEARPIGEVEIEVCSRATTARSTAASRG